MINHSRVVALMSGDRLTSMLIRDYFDLPRRDALVHAFLKRGLGQADIVLCLLYLRDRAGTNHRRALSYYIRRFVGKPIEIGVPCLLRYRTNGHATITRPTPRGRRVIWVQDSNPRLNQTDAFFRWSSVKVGRTVSQLRARGVTARDIRNAERHGWIRLEPTT